MAGSSFAVDVAAIRDRARQKMELGGNPDFDPATRRLMEKILQEEEEHADDIVDLLAT